MNHNMDIVVIFVTFIVLISCSSHLSFAEKNNENEEDDKDLYNYIVDSSINTNKILII